MKLTKQTEEEIKLVMDDYWDSYFKGDLKHWEHYLVDDYRNIGGTAEEIWNSKKEILDYTHRIIHQMTGVSEIRNKKTELIPIDPYIMVHEFMDIYIKIEDEWSFYQKFRLSTIIQKMGAEWKVLHQHGSYPDSKTQEGEAFAFDTLKNENIRLQKLVKNRTHELEIEAALERVRAIAMGMRTADDLFDICEILYKELQLLGFDELRNAMINIYEDAKVYFLNYDYAPGPGKTITQIPYNLHPLVDKQVRETKNVNNAFNEFCFSGKELKDFRKLRKNNGEQDDSKLDETFSLHYYFYSIGIGAIGISTYHAITDEKKNLLKRFRNVFELAYRRYIDINKAEAQAREAKIQLTLERVRARTMAMHHTSELQEVIHTVHQELLTLNIAINGGSFIVINSEVDTTLRCWGSGGTADTSEEVHIPFYDKPFSTHLIKKIKKGPSFFTEEYTQKEKKDFFEFLFQYEPWSKLDVKQQEKTLSSPGGYTRSCCVSPYTSIFIINHFGENFSAADNDILKRFGNVFEQTYTRFLDLQKAEAQAREAKIEAALEKARSRSMGMQSSDELPEVANVLFLEVQALGIPAWSCGYNIITEDKTVATCWMSSEGTLQLPFKLRLFGEATFAEMGDFIRSNQTMLVQELGDKALEEHYAYMKSFPDLKPTFDQLDELGLSLPTYQINHLCKFTQGFLLFITYEKVPASHDVFKRFTKVFGQTYTRFLDLQKAEAQTREAQIELGLERVRARTMAMQQSDELNDVAAILFNQLRSLGGSLWTCAIVLCNDLSNEDEFRTAFEGGLQPSVFVPHNEDEVHIKMYEGWKNAAELFTISKNGGELQAHYAYMMTVPSVKPTFEKMLASGISFPIWQKWHAAYFTAGYLMIITTEKYREESIFVRFAKVFEQTYTRFLDLQKAEAQTREAEIELALERIRARTMAMQHSHELQDAAMLLFQQIEALGVPAFGCGFNIWDNDHEFATAWMAGQLRLQPPFKTSGTEDIFLRIHDAAEQEDSLFVEEQEGEALKAHYEYMNSIPVFKEITVEMAKMGLPLPMFQIMHCAYFSQGYLMFITHESVPFAHDIFKRFAKVFEQTYTRFLDLQKAEAQARKAQIEAAIERVRAQSMAMHHPDDLNKVNKEILSQLNLLQIQGLTGVTFYLIDENGWVKAWDFSSPGNIGDQSSYTLQFDSKKYEMLGFPFKTLLQTDLDYFVADYPLEKLEKAVYEFEEIDPAIAKIVKEALSTGILTHQWTSCCRISNGLLGIDLVSPPNEDTKAIVLKMAGAFNQAYTRFLDLQKAEAQSKEAQIQLALERVRARTMAMQKSDELAEVSFLLNKQVVELGIPTRGCAFNIYSEHDSSEWFSNLEGTIPVYKTPRENIFLKYYEAGQRGETLLIEEFGGERIKEHYQYLATLSVADNSEETIEKNVIAVPEYQIDHAAYFKYGYLLFITLRPAPEAHEVFKRFAKEFEQTYTRFLDLQKAEAQARESQIELSLERVRAKAMAMHSSEDLALTVDTFFSELNALHVIPRRCGVTLINVESRIANLTVTTATQNGETKKITGELKLFGHPVLNNVYENWKLQQEYHPILQGAEIKRYYHVMNPQVSYPDFAEDEKQFGHYFFFKEGGVFAWTDKDLTEEELQIFRKFTSVLSLTYRRYMDLAEAELQTKEAQVEAALERVRSRTLAMQKSEELAETAAVLFQQLIKLGIAPNRLYIGIINDDSGNIEAWATDEAGGKINNTFTLSSKKNVSVQKMYDAWKAQKKSITIDMQGKELADYIQYLSGEIGVSVSVGLTQQRRLQNVAYFGKGFIGIASPEEQPAATINLLERFAAVFNLTYTRFSDLKIAEAHALQAEEDLIKLQKEKKRAEDALTELKATQTQLIQSEKMASLGELTAGIAHEIQNPLNFVNNFSEVSAEMIQEIKEERAKNKDDRDETLLDEVIEDISKNLEKINLHGNRASSIVKGMLEHSRTSSGQKELTDINALADEYLKLTYHGLRAKDKSFNAEMKTNFEESLPKIAIVPQDFGRVLLNLINNAFYACTERSKSAVDEKQKAESLKPKPKAEGYKPTVTVTTKSSNLKVEITIADNGNGIPKNIIDKIFQPFFTTKPTGKGTGLGLSLAYDIVKAHGGELKVETIEGQGSKFIIQL